MRTGLQTDPAALENGLAELAGLWQIKDIIMQQFGYRTGVRHEQGDRYLEAT